LSEHVLRCGGNSSAQRHLPVPALEPPPPPQSEQRLYLTSHEAQTISIMKSMRLDGSGASSGRGRTPPTAMSRRQTSQAIVAFGSSNRLLRLRNVAFLGLPSLPFLPSLPSLGSSLSGVPIDEQAMQVKTCAHGARRQTGLEAGRE